MPKIQATETINLGEGKSLKVSELSDKSKALVEVYDVYRQKLFDANEEVQMISIAVNAVLNQIRTQVLDHLTPKEEASSFEEGVQE